MHRVASVIHLSYARNHHLTGKGIGIAVLDTGISPHPDFQGDPPRIATFRDFVRGRSTPYDDHGHGTHVCGILAGSGQCSHGHYEGIAPDSHLIVLKVLNARGECNTSHILAAIKWLLHHQKQYNIRIVNLSVGSTPRKKFTVTSPLVAGVEELWKAGMVVLTAAGNHGPAPHSIGAPGNSRRIITVGSSDHLQNHLDPDYSSRGPTGNCIKKPDIVAPGSHIISCSNLYHQKPLPQNAYDNRSGTSMSTPVVSGSVALLLQKDPHLKPKNIKQCLHDSALCLGYPHEQQGWGLLQLDRFLQY